MSSPVGYTEWGYLGGLIFIVVSFLGYLIRRDAASAKREKAQQDFFARLFDEGRASTSELAGVVRELIHESRQHHMETTIAITRMYERTQPLPKQQGPDEPAQDRQDHA